MAESSPAKWPPVETCLLLNCVTDGGRNVQSIPQICSFISLTVQRPLLPYNETKKHGFMYGHGFQNPDSHIWELVCMTPEAAESNTTAGNT
jgi:predicted lactoylglutathione lyase